MKTLYLLLWIALPTVIGIFLAIYFIVVKKAYYYCSEGKCVKGGKTYKNDPTCANQCGSNSGNDSESNGGSNSESNGGSNSESNSGSNSESNGGYYEGDKKATTTFFTSGESTGLGACGGCTYPGIKYMEQNVSYPNSSFNNLFLQLKEITTDGVYWTMGASSEAMMAPYCPGQIGMGCTGRDDPKGTLRPPHVGHVGS